MRKILFAAAAGLMLAPISASACQYGQLNAVEASVPVEAVPVATVEAQPAADEMSAAKKKKEKVEYMKSAAGPEPKPAKKSKKKKK